MDLTTGKISDHICHIAIPASIGLFFNTMYNVIDTLFAGLISTQALAALSISFPIFFIMIAFVTGLSTGSSALISNVIGQGRRSEIRMLTAQVLSFAVATYAIITPFCLFFSSTLFQLLGAQDDYLHMSVGYMNIIFLGSIFFILLYCANSILLAHGNSKAMRNYLVGGCALNALLDPWFIFGGFGIPSMGLNGVAIATVTVMLIGCLYIFYEAHKEGYLNGIKLTDYMPEKKHFFAIAQQSFPASFNMLTIGIGIFVIMFFIKDFGEAAVAAYGICIRIDQVALLPTIGLTMAALSLIGQNNGAGNIDRVRETLRQSLAYGLAIIICGSIIIFVFAHTLVSFFTNDTAVISIGTTYLKISAFTAAAYVILSLNVSALQGMKKPIPPLLIGIARQIVVPSTVFYILINILKYNITSIWYGIFAISWSAAAFTFFFCRYMINKQSKPEF